MIPRMPETADLGRNADLDPMADIASILDDSVAAGLDPRRLAFASVIMRFADRASWESATQTAAPEWEVAAYSTGEGHMLRLSRKAHATRNDLERLRADALAFASSGGAEWLSMSIEDLEQAPTTWQALSALAEIRLPEQRPSPAVQEEVQVQPIQQGGIA